MPRLPEIARDAMEPEQARVYDDIAGGPRGGVRGPFVPLLHSTPLADCVQRLGAFVRYRCSVPQRLRELAILVTARHWGADYEWYAHETHARDAGLGDGIIEAVRAGRRPEFAGAEEEEAVYDFCTELHATHRVRDETYRRAAERLGDRGVVDLTGLLGYYTLIAMTLNVFEMPAPEGAPAPFAG